MPKQSGKKEDKTVHRIKNTTYTRNFDSDAIKKLAHKLYVARQQKLGGVTNDNK